jgi:hypothetical protein
MNNTMNRFNKALVAIAIGTLAIGSATAQPRDGGPEKVGAYMELFGALKSWAKTNVVPQLRTWKTKLDGSMTSEDLAALNALRARAAQLRKDAMATGVAMHKAWKSEDYDALKQNREKMKSFGEARKALFGELKPLAIKYKATLEAIGAEAKPKMETWKKEGREIAMRWIQENKDRIGDGGLPPMKNMGKMMGMGGEMGRKIAAAYFMLWDGEDFLDHMQGLGGEGGGAVPELD